MSFDFLGTFTKKQYDVIKKYTLNSKDLLTHDAYLDYTQGEHNREMAYANRLALANVNLGTVTSDYAYQKDIKQANQHFKYKLSDADTGTIMQTLKDIQYYRITFCRDNIEYKIKRSLDRLESVEKELVDIPKRAKLIADYLKIIENHYEDGLHTHNINNVVFEGGVKIDNSENNLQTIPPVAPKSNTNPNVIV